MTRLISHQRLVTGVSHHPGRTVDRAATWRPVEFPLAAHLIETTDGYWLFDTGTSSHLGRITTEGRFVDRLAGRLYHRVVPTELDPAGGVAGQLRIRGIDPVDVARVIVSHFHPDHIGGLRDFDRAELLADPAGLAEVTTARAIDRARLALYGALLPERGNWTDLHREPTHRLDWPGWETVPAWRLSSDDSIVAVALPGHASGHIGLLLGGGEGTFLVADATWLTSAIVDHRPPSRLTRPFQRHWTSYLRTLERLHHLNRARPRLELVACHCGSQPAQPLRGGSCIASSHTRSTAATRSSS